MRLSPNSDGDIAKIQELAELNHLQVVPLVQTFGHVEVGGGPPSSFAAWLFAYLRP